MKWNACLVLLGVAAASCGGRAASESVSPGSSGSGGVGNGAGQSANRGGELPVGGSGNGVAGTGITNQGGSSPIGAQGGSSPIGVQGGSSPIGVQGGSSPIGVQGGVSGTASNAPDAGVVIVSDAGTVCDDFGTSCLSTPLDATCTSDADCMAAVFPSCGTRPIIGLNKTGKIICSGPDCVPPPPGGPPSYYELQDCTQVGDPRQASVRCVSQTCLTYYAGCKDCLE